METAFRIKRVRLLQSIGLTLTLLVLTSCTSGTQAEQKRQAVLDTQTGEATFYARSLHGDKTASGLKLDNRKAVAAHRTYPFGTVARVTNLQNGRAVNVVIVDRGPFGKNRREGAIIDLSRAVAEDLGSIRDGQVKVKVEVLAWGNGASTKRE
jgi:rare lipoprotein A